MAFFDSDDDDIIVLDDDYQPVASTSKSSYHPVPTSMPQNTNQDGDMNKSVAALEDEVSTGEHFPFQPMLTVIIWCATPD